MSSCLISCGMVQLQHTFMAVAEGAEFLVQAWRRVMEVGGLLQGVCRCRYDTIISQNARCLDCHQQAQLRGRVMPPLVVDPPHSSCHRAGGSCAATAAARCDCSRASYWRKHPCRQPRQRRSAAAGAVTSAMAPN